MKHADLGKVWKEYPSKIHYWLLQLTEEYDLTFKLSNEETNLVPCLLPEKKPEVFINYLTFKLSNEKTNLVPCLLPEKKPEVFRNYLTFKLSNEKTNLVPYLFPEKKPEVFRNDFTFKISNWFQICFL